MEMFKSGEGFDCVIEVVPNDGHGQGKVYFYFYENQTCANANLATDFVEINYRQSRLILLKILHAEKVH
jgi:hypothetical protein